ncbi:MAG: FHA domain-containing protein [Hyphomicrobiaceae bacterium]
MQDKIYLAVRNHTTGDYYVAACVLPVQIGRDKNANNQILLDWRYPTISRVHGTIEKTPRGLTYRDQSANGSRVGGLVVRDGQVALSPQFQIEVENYTISRVEVEPFVIIGTDGDLVVQQSIELLPGRGVGVAQRSPQHGGSQFQLLDLNRWIEGEMPQVGKFEVIDHQPVWVMSADATAKVLRNKSPITQARTPLASLDVIEIDGWRFELLLPHDARIVCGYDHCHLLNPPPLEANCRFCGRHLGNSGGFSRILFTELPQDGRGNDDPPTQRQRP